MKMNKNIAICSLSGLQYGYNTSIIAGALLFLTEAFSLTPFQEGWLVAIVFLGACVACSSGILSNYIGRRKTLALSVLFFLLGSLLSTCAPSYLYLFLGRLCTGIGAGIAITVSPLYLVEMSPKETRGSIVNVNQVAIAIGALLAPLSAYLCVDTQNWRLLFGMSALPALIQGIGLFFIPESKDLADKKTSSETGSWKAFFASNFRSRFYLIFALCAVQSFIGANAISYFAPRVFEQGGFTTNAGALLGTVLLGIVYFVAMFISFKTIDRFGRRQLLFLSLGGMALSLLTVAFTLWLDLPYANTITLLSIMLYTGCYALGMGPIPSLITSEITPQVQRGHALTFLGIAGWLVGYVVSLTFLPLMDVLSLSGLFTLYALFGIGGFAFFYKALPETKQKSLEEIEQLLQEK